MLNFYPNLQICFRSQKNSFLERFLKNRSSFDTHIGPISKKYGILDKLKYFVNYISPNSTKNKDLFEAHIAIFCILKNFVKI